VYNIFFVDNLINIVYKGILDFIESKMVSLMVRWATVLDKDGDLELVEINRDVKPNRDRYEKTEKLSEIRAYTESLLYSLIHIFRSFQNRTLADI